MSNLLCVLIKFVCVFVFIEGCAPWKAHCPVQSDDEYKTAFVLWYIHTYIYIHTILFSKIICKFIHKKKPGVVLPRTYIHTYIHTYTYIYIQYIYIHIHTYIHTYMHTCIHAYMHTYIHTCTQHLKQIQTASHTIQYKQCSINTHPLLMKSAHNY